MTKWAAVDASALSDSSSPRRMAKSSLRAAAKCCAGTVPFVASRWDLRIGQVRTEIWTVPRLIARIIPGRKNVSGAELNPVSLCGVNHALHQADDSSPPLPAFAALPAAGMAVWHVGLVPESSFQGREASHGDTQQRESVPKFGTRCPQTRGGGLKSPKRIGCHGFARSVWRLGAKRRYPQFREQRISSRPIAPLHPRVTFAGTVLLAFYADAIARIRGRGSV
jgi:hypothetical protein